MKRIFNLGASKADGSGGNSDSVCSNGDGGVITKSIRRLTSSEMDSDAEMQFQSLIPPRDPDSWQLLGDEEEFHDVELRLHDDDEKSDSETGEAGNSAVRRRSNKKQKSLKKRVWGRLACKDARGSSKTFNCCRVS